MMLQRLMKAPDSPLVCEAKRRDGMTMSKALPVSIQYDANDLHSVRVHECEREVHMVHVDGMEPS